MFPKKTVGSVVGIGSMFGAIGGMLLAASTGLIINSFGFLPLFIIAGSNYLIALAIIHLLVPKLKTVNL
jgi:ACS family hexuronate transporter-like MFS transporter